MNKKGFSIIELLLVVVLLALIAIVSSRTIFYKNDNVDTEEEVEVNKPVGNQIEDNKLTSIKISCSNLITSIEKYASVSDLGIEGYEVSVPKTKCVLKDVNWNSECEEFIDSLSSKVRGNMPTEAEFQVDSNNNVSNNSYFKYDDYTCSYSNNIVNCTK